MTHFGNTKTINHQLISNTFANTLDASNFGTAKYLNKRHIRLFLSRDAENRILLNKKAVTNIFVTAFFIVCCGKRDRTADLRVMNPTQYGFI